MLNRWRAERAELTDPLIAQLHLVHALIDEADTDERKEVDAKIAHQSLMRMIQERNQPVMPQAPGAGPDQEKLLEPQKGTPIPLFGGGGGGGAAEGER